MAALGGTPARLGVGFCATDVVNFPVILGWSEVAEAMCPATGLRIRVVLSPTSVLELDLPKAVVSKVHLSPPVKNVRDLCDFFSSPQIAGAGHGRTPRARSSPLPKSSRSAGARWTSWAGQHSRRAELYESSC